MRALAIAATGMTAQTQNIEVIANNIANINTTAFKRSRAEFTDLIYQAERIQGVSNRGQNSVVPEGAQIGLGVRTAAIRPLNIQGSLTNTGNQLDLAINGRGWFQVTSSTGETLYTRAGSFSTNANAQIVTSDGYQIQPSIVVPANTTAVTVSQSGVVSATISGQTNPSAADRPAHHRQFRQRRRTDGARRKPVPTHRRLRSGGDRRARRSGLRPDQPGLSGSLQRRSGLGNHQHDRGAARL